jgi:hypothetical protein
MLNVLHEQPLLPPMAEAQSLLIWHRIAQDILVDLEASPTIKTAVARATCLSGDMEEAIPEFHAYSLSVWATNMAIAATHARHGRIDDALRITRDLLRRIERMQAGVPA